MFHGLSNEILYAAYKITATFADAIGNIKSGSGTCFFVKNIAGELCLITNRHVLDISYNNQVPEPHSYSLRKVVVSGKTGRRGDNFPVADLTFEVLPEVSFHKNVRNDIACISPCRCYAVVDAVIDYFLPHSILATASDFEQKLSVCDFVAFPGFPEWHDKSASRPILRAGTISSDPRFDYSYEPLVAGACVAYEAFSYNGSSGSPVFAVQKGPKPGEGVLFPGFRELMLIGINAGHLKTSDKSHSGISYLYKSSAILELIDQ